MIMRNRGLFQIEELKSTKLVSKRLPESSKTICHLKTADNLLFFIQENPQNGTLVGLGCYEDTNFVQNWKSSFFENEKVRRLASGSGELVFRGSLKLAKLGSKRTGAPISALSRLSESCAKRHFCSFLTFPRKRRKILLSWS